MFYLDFEEKLEKFDMEIQSLIKLSKESDIDVDGKIKDIEKKNKQSYIEFTLIYHLGKLLNLQGIRIDLKQKVL